MPAPQATALEADIKKELDTNGFRKASAGGQDFEAQFTGAWELFIDALTKDWTDAWAVWQLGHSAFVGNKMKVVSGVTVSGGSDGKVVETAKLDFIIRWPYRRHQRFLEFEEALVTVLKSEFSKWSSTYTCKQLKYVGSSSHTPILPGLFSVVNVPQPIGKIGSGQNPSLITQQVTAILDGKGWRTSHPLCRIRLFLDAIQAALNKHFAEWLEKTKIIGDTATGVASAGAGLGIGVSANTGKLV